MGRPGYVRFLVCAAAAAIVCAAGGAARAASPPSVIMPDGSVRYEYGRRPGPLLVCKPQYVCDITLESGESVLNMAIGDAAHWIVAGGQSGPNGTTPHVFVKPLRAALGTNLLITTNKRAYDVALRSADDAKHPHLSFFYADDDAAARAQIADHERAAVESVLAGTPLVGIDRADAKYKFAGDMTLAPETVFNDGARTFVRWKTLPGELPLVFGIAKDGTAQAVNFRVVGSAYIIDGLDSAYDLVVAANGDRRGRPERRVSIRHI